MRNNILKWFDVYFRPQMFLMLILGFSSGMPLALSGSTLAAWLVGDGIEITYIGLFALIGIPYALKFLWSPIMDRFVPPFLGRRRGWMLITQLATIAAIFILSFLEPATSLFWIAITAVAIAFFSASQDIVLDAYRTERLAEEERGAGSAVWIMGYRMAMLIGGAFALVLSDIRPWGEIYRLMGLLMGVGCLATLLCKEPGVGEREDHRYTPPKSFAEAVVLPLRDLFSRRGIGELAIFITIYKIGDIAAAQMTTPYILKHIGFSNSELGYIYKGFGMVATILGTIIGGALLSRWRLQSALLFFGALQGLSTLAFIILEYTGRDLSALALVIGIENIAGGMGTTAYIALLMALCNTRFTATQYALLSSLMAFSRQITGAPTGYLVNFLGWELFFIFCALLALPSILMLKRFNKWEVVASSPPPSPR